VPELDPDAAAVEGASRGGEIALGRGHWERLRREVLSQGIQRGLEVSPAAEYVEDSFALVGISSGSGYVLRGGGHWGFLYELWRALTHGIASKIKGV
jgi:hypothetical protein